MRVLALTSGGIDSLCMLHWLKAGPHAWAKNEVRAVHWSYGQSASDEELKAAQKIADWTNTPIDYFQLHDSIRFKKGLIPFRNLFLISSTGMKLGHEDAMISLGVHSGTNYYDCSSTFMQECDHTLQNHTGGRIRLIAPFLHWTKSDIFRYVYKHNLPVHLTYSCESGGEVPCGSCASCKDRESLCVP